jgi:hypothetical protein
MLKKLFVISLIILGLGQISFGQKAASPAKKKLIEQLSAKTEDMLPVKIFEDFFEKSYEPKSVEIAKGLVDNLTKSVEESDMSNEKKESVKAKIPAFSERFVQLTKSLMSKGYDVKLWTKKSLEKNYSTRFTLAELQKLNRFLSSKDGIAFKDLFKKQTTDKINGGEEKTGDEDETEAMVYGKVEKYLGAALSEKFLSGVVTKAMDDISKSIDVWGNTMLQNLEKETTTGVLKQEIDKFIAENQ